MFPLKLGTNVLIGCLFTAVWASPSLAGFTPAVTVTPGVNNIFNNGFGYTIGYSFVALTSITVNELGYFDHGGATLTESHDVGIWDASGDLLANTTVTNGGLLEGNFLYEAISAITLSAGQTYTVAGVSGFVDPYVSNQTDAIFSSSISFVADEYVAGATLTLPTISDGEIGFFGGTFGTLTPATVPEPTSLVMLCLGLLATAGIGSSARKAHRSN